MHAVDLPSRLSNLEAAMAKSVVARWIVLTTLMASAACSDSMSPPPAFTGTWTGATASGGTAFNVTMTTTEANGQISGSGLFTVGSAGGIAFTVTGSHAHPQVSLTIGSSGAQDANFSGRFTSDRVVDGTLNGSGFVNVPLILQRQ
jgi:hypothetical protein